MRVLGKKDPQRVELSQGGAVDVRPLGWREARRIRRKLTDEETGKVDPDELTAAVMKAAIVEVHEFEGSVEELIEDLAAGEAAAIEAAALVNYRRAETTLGESKASSSG